jgi:hypothetical protein
MYTRARPRPGGGNTHHPLRSTIPGSHAPVCADLVTTLHASGHDPLLGYDRDMAEQTTQSVEQQLEEIGTRLAWVRDYL